MPISFKSIETDVRLPGVSARFVRITFVAEIDNRTIELPSLIEPDAVQEVDWIRTAHEDVLQILHRLTHEAEKAWRPRALPESE